MTAKSPTRNMQRLLLGICACAMIVVGTIGWYADSWPVFFNSMLRAGILLFGVWLAYPQMTRGRWRVTVGVGIAAIVVVALLAARPRLIPVVVVFLIVLAALQTIIPRLFRRR